MYNVGVSRRPHLVPVRLRSDYKGLPQNGKILFRKKAGCFPPQFLPCKLDRCDTLVLGKPADEAIPEETQSSYSLPLTRFGPKRPQSGTHGPAPHKAPSFSSAASTAFVLVTHAQRLRYGRSAPARTEGALVLSNGQSGEHTPIHGDSDTPREVWPH